MIVPSFPGFGFSTPLPDNPDMNLWKVADLWHTLMTRGPRRGTEIRRSAAIEFLPCLLFEPRCPAWSYRRSLWVRLTTAFGAEIRPDAVAAKSSPLGDVAFPLPDHDRTDSVLWNRRRRDRPGSLP